jgi:ParB/RepB/Spo0J family partition protein
MKQRKLTDGPGTRPGIPLPAFSNQQKAPSFESGGSDSSNDIQSSNASGPVSIDISLLDDSPDQYRIVYPESEIAELANLLKAGQITPIRVRKKSNGRFEIIAGHRRKRAAPIAGMTNLLAFVVEVDDIRAAIELMVDNESQEGVGDFERATGYQSLLEKGLSQSAVADAMGINKSLVSKRLSFFKLPSPILEVLSEYPRAYSWNTVEKLLPLLKDDPELIEAAAHGTKLVGTGDWSHQTFIAQMCQQKKKKSLNSESKVTGGFAITDLDSRPILTMKSKPNGRVEIQLANDIDQSVFMTRLNQLLREEASKPDSELRRQDQIS